MKELTLAPVLILLLSTAISLAQTTTTTAQTTTTAAATTTTSGCSADADCPMPANPWAGATFCDSTGMKVSQYKITPKCISGTCNNQYTEQAVKEDCTPSNKICDFTTAGGGVYACIAGTPPSQCAANSPITTRCICGSAVAGGAYYTWSGYDPGYCCGSGSSAYQTSPGPCPTTTTTPPPTTTPISNQTNQTTATTSLLPISTSPVQTSATLPSTTQQNVSVTTSAATTTTYVSTTSNTCSVPNGAGIYSNGLCAINYCNSGYYNCDGNSVNGCESLSSCSSSSANGTPAGKKQTCADSDNGLSIYSRGFATDKDGNISEDKCSENNLAEFYCKDGEVASHETTCANGCNDGACVSPFAKLIQDLIALLKSIFGLK